jgi:CheY-like chemotaxis protein
MAIDDFGTAGLSMFHLERYPVQSIKIDPSFLRETGRPSSGITTITAIVTMARNLGIRVIAEGVESQKELQLVQSMACDGYQGTFFSPALPRTLFAELMRKMRIRRGEKKVEQPAPISESVPQAMPAATVSPVPRKTAEHSIVCPNCHNPYDALVADWCSCLTAEQTLACTHCRKCYCRAPLEIRHKIWDDAPEALWDRKRRQEADLVGLPENPVPGQTKGPLVLLVDDERPILRTGWRLIRSLGFTAIVAQNGEEGLQLARKYKPKIILTDALMPKLGGQEMCQILKQDPETASIKTVIMTAFSGAAKYKTAILKESQFDEQLQKPVEFERLRVVLQKLLG